MNWKGKNLHCIEISVPKRTKYMIQRLYKTDFVLKSLIKN